MAAEKLSYIAVVCKMDGKDPAYQTLAYTSKSTNLGLKTLAIAMWQTGQSQELRPLISQAKFLVDSIEIKDDDDHKMFSGSHAQLIVSSKSTKSSKSTNSTIKKK